MSEKVNQSLQKDKSLNIEAQETVVALLAYNTRKEQAGFI